MLSIIALLLMSAGGSLTPTVYATAHENTSMLGGGSSNRWAVHAAAHRDHELGQLRAEALKIQARDGGRLTPEHRATLQQRLDALNRHLASVNR